MMTDSQTEAVEDAGGRPSEPTTNRGCWFTGAFLVLLFSMPCVLGGLYWRFGIDEPSSQTDVRAAGDAHCMTVWNLVQEYHAAHHGYPPSLRDLESAPEKPEFMHDLSATGWSHGRYYRIEYTFDDPSVRFGTSIRRRR